MAAKVMLGRIGPALVLLQFIAVSAVGNSLQEGVGAYSREDYQTALEEWRSLAGSGHAAAQFNLGLMHALGKGVAQDYSIAAEWYRKAAEQGLANAQNNLGFLYIQGYGVQRDYSQALKWYRKAAEQGLAAAEFSLGALYLRGLGVPLSYAKALEWYGKAADKGYAAAQYSLGIMYFRGLGVLKDHDEAAKWYRKAAQQGYADAKSALRLMATESKTAHALPQRHYALKMLNEIGSRETSFQVQLGAVSADARATAEKKANELTRSLAAALGTLKVTTIRADLGERGIFYRFRVGPLADRAAADALCEKLKAQQQPCIVVNPSNREVGSQAAAGTRLTSTTSN